MTLTSNDLHQLINDASTANAAPATADAERLSNYANLLGAAPPAGLTAADRALPAMSISGSGEQNTGSSWLSGAGRVVGAMATGAADRVSSAYHAAAGMAENLYEHPKQIAASGLSAAEQTAGDMASSAAAFGHDLVTNPSAALKDTKQAASSVVSGLETAGNAVAHGAVSAGTWVVDHPIEAATVAGAAAVEVASVGTATPFLAAAAGLGTAATVATGFNLADAMDEDSPQMSVLMNADRYSPAEVAAAGQKLGADTSAPIVNLGLMAAGGVAARGATSLIGALGGGEEAGQVAVDGTEAATAAGADTPPLLPSPPATPPAEALTPPVQPVAEALTPPPPQQPPAETFTPPPQPPAETLALPVQPPAEAVSSQVSDTQVLQKAAPITGKVDSALPLNDRAGLSLDEWDQRWDVNDLHNVPVRVKGLDPVDNNVLPDSWQSLVANRTAGATGNIGDSGTESHILVRQADGTVAPYTRAELEPSIVESAPAKDSALVFNSQDRPIDNLKVGDTLRRGEGQYPQGGQYPTGVRSDWQPWHGAVIAGNENGNSIVIPGGRLWQKDGVTLLGKDGLPSDQDPLSVQIGDELNVTNPDVPQGKYTVAKIKGLSTSKTSPLLDDEYRVVGLSNGEAKLASTSPRSKPDVTFTVPTQSLSEPAFRKIEPFSVEPGDQIVAPTGTSAPNSSDWRFKANIQGRQWTVSGVQDNGVILTNNGSHFLVPKEYLNTRTMFPLDQWQARTGS